MTVTEVLQHAQALSVEERKQLIKLLVDTLDAPEITTETEPSEHWGKSLNQLLMSHDDDSDESMDDPVAWVKNLREEQRKKRLGDW